MYLCVLGVSMLSLSAIFDFEIDQTMWYCLFFFNFISYRYTLVCIKQNKEINDQFVVFTKSWVFVLKNIMNQFNVLPFFCIKWLLLLWKSFILDLVLAFWLVFEALILFCSLLIFVDISAVICFRSGHQLLYQISHYHIKWGGLAGFWFGTSITWIAEVCDNAKVVIKGIIFMTEIKHLEIHYNYWSCTGVHCKLYDDTGEICCFDIVRGLLYNWKTSTWADLTCRTVYNLQVWTVICDTSVHLFFSSGVKLVFDPFLFSLLPP